MVFSSVTFLFYFLPIFLILYYSARKELKNIILLLASLLFYVWGEGKFVLVLIADIFINYIFASLIDKTTNRKYKKIFLGIAVSLNLILLFYYKYADFGIKILNDVGQLIQLEEIPLLNTVLPIGLSFFIFQGMSYVIDVYKNDVPIQKDPLKVALYISMFPQLIAGPIVRYSDIYKNIEKRAVDTDRIYYGTCRFISGLGKKVIIADILAITADRIFMLPIDQLTISIAWLGAVCYTLQIYFDFSGYSDMAIGLGKLLGFNFDENFNLPYISTSVSEFWRRWHISLSTWFRDYLYIPLGGNRKGNVYINLLIVFFCTGLWHGASYYFIFWGLWHGFFVVLEKILKKKGIVIQGVLGWIYTMMVVVVGWVFFHERGIKYIGAMFGLCSKEFKWYGIDYYLDAQVVFTIILGIILSSGLVQKIFNRLEEKAYRKTVVHVIRDISLAIILFCCIYMIASGNYSPFIYFRF